MSAMPHRLFHAVVLAALPACGSTTTTDPPGDAARDTTAASDTATSDTSTPDTATSETSVVTDTEISDTCYCKPGCLPCIK